MTSADVPRRVRAVVERALDVGVEGCECPGEGAVADTYLLDLAGNPARAVCKFGGESVWTGDVVEPLVVRLVGRETDLPVPAVLESGSIRGPGPDRWALYEFRPGVPARQATIADREAFREGYRSRAPFPPAYPARVRRYRALWVAQSAVNLGSVAATPRGRVQLARQVRDWLGRNTPRGHERT